MKRIILFAILAALLTVLLWGCGSIQEATPTQAEPPEPPATPQEDIPLPQQPAEPAPEAPALPDTSLEEEPEPAVSESAADYEEPPLEEPEATTESEPTEREEVDEGTLGENDLPII